MYTPSSYPRVSESRIRPTQPSEYRTECFTVPNIYARNLIASSMLKSNNTQNQDKYYHTFSKYALMETPTTTEVSGPKFVYSDFIQSSNFSFDKYKLPDLKVVAKHYNLHVSGNKPVLIERIRTFFCQTKSATTIQRIFRGHIIRFCTKLRGPAYIRRDICVNETDFYTLEPLKDISYKSFFSYIDDQQYIYGFDICSIISLISKTTHSINPYNRAEFPYKATVALHGLYNITKIVFPEIWVEHYASQPSKIDNPLSQIIVFSYSTTTPMTTSSQNPSTITNTIIRPNSQRTTPNITDRRTRIEYQREMNRDLEHIRSRPLETRVRELFIEVNLLGNYADSRWFMELDRIRLARFYQSYYDWWHTRSRMTHETQQNICIFDDPFSDVHLLYVYPTTTIEVYREACLRLMENMVYGSRETEYRTLGAMQMLSILTMVSLPTRTAMPWLYESLYV